MLIVQCTSDLTINLMIWVTMDWPLYKWHLRLFLILVKYLDECKLVKNLNFRTTEFYVLEKIIDSHLGMLKIKRTLEIVHSYLHLGTWRQKYTQNRIFINISVRLHGTISHIQNWDITKISKNLRKSRKGDQFWYKH